MSKSTSEVEVETAVGTQMHMLQVVRNLDLYRVLYKHKTASARSP